MLKLRVLTQIYRFAQKKEIIVKNFFNQRQIGAYTSFNDEEVEKFIQDVKISKNAWRELPKIEHEAILSKYYEQLSNDETSEQMADLLSQCTGKQLQECKSEARVALKILKHHLTYPYIKIRHFEQEIKQYQKDYYQFEPFDNILAVFDHRHPILSAVKYLGLALQSSNPLILRPSHHVLPVANIFSRIWNDNCQIPMVQVLADPHLDPKHDESPIKNFLQSSQGLVSFDGRLKDGLDFHYYMNKNSIVMRESEFLLTSSDSAYVMSNLSNEQLAKSAKIIARGAFSNCGHNFNSIKRVYVDKEVGQSFLGLLVTQSRQYKASEEANLTDVNHGLLAPFVFKSEFEESLAQLNTIRESHKDQIKHISGGEQITVKVAEKEVKFITPAIFQIIADFPNYSYQDQEFMFPVCFVSFVDSPSDCIQKINSSIFGTTASIFTSDNRYESIKPIGKKLDVGTVNVNTWQITDGITYSGRKRSGKGFSFSPLSFNNIVRTKSVSYG